MNFLLDTDTCSAHMRRSAQLAHRFVQHTGVTAELHPPASQRPATPNLVAGVCDRGTSPAGLA
jgi:hypothetical protein